MLFSLLFFYNIVRLWENIGVHHVLVRKIEFSNYRPKVKFNYKERMFINQSISEIYVFHLVISNQGRTEWNKEANISVRDMTDIPPKKAIYIF